MSDEPTRLLETEELLANDPEGTYRDEVLGHLAEQDAAVKSALDSGLAPDEFQILSRFRDALGAAETAVNQLWRGFNAK